jgi:hypothetical protein
MGITLSRGNIECQFRIAATASKPNSDIGGPAIASNKPVVQQCVQTVCGLLHDHTDSRYTLEPMT